jgi:hypothetical protein
VSCARAWSDDNITQAIDKSAQRRTRDMRRSLIEIAPNAFMNFPRASARWYHAPRSTEHDDMSWAIVCESSDLAVQSLGVAQLIELPVEPSVSDDPYASALASLAGGRPTALALLTLPRLEHLVELAHTAREHGVRLSLALPAAVPERRELLEVAAELGVCAVAELRPLGAALALLQAAAHDAFAASARQLGPADRARLHTALINPSRSGLLVPLDAQRIGYASTPEAAPIALGEAADVAEALLALRRMQLHQTEVVSSVDGVDTRAVLDIIFGPRRALSDPTSKAVLAPYGLPLPVEELCGSASRAASEASRIGFPVRISLASPDLRVWDHPDLSVDMVDNAARVRDTFRQLIAAAEGRFGGDQSERRVLGVLVAATSDALALLHVRATPLPRGRVAMHVGFADPHGRAAGDETVTILPAEQPVIERALKRLAGAPLLFATSPAQRKARVDGVAEVLQRVAAFLNDRRREIESVELRPLAVLLDGSAEVREACVTVSNWFEQNT